MATVTIIIKDIAGEIEVSGEVDPPMVEGQMDFTPAEISGLYMRSNIEAIMQAASAWARGEKA